MPLKHFFLLLATTWPVYPMTQYNAALGDESMNARFIDVAERYDEMYFGTGSAIPKQLEASRIAARQSRMKANRAQTCRTCEEEVSISG